MVLVLGLTAMVCELVLPVLHVKELLVLTLSVTGVPAQMSVPGLAEISGAF